MAFVQSDISTLPRMPIDPLQLAPQPLCIQALLSEHGDASDLLRTDSRELLQCEFDAPGAARLHALMELARHLTRPVSKGYQITSIDDVVALVGPEMCYLDHEEIRVLVLNLDASTI